MKKKNKIIVIIGTMLLIGLMVSNICTIITYNKKIQRQKTNFGDIIFNLQDRIEMFEQSNIELEKENDEMATIIEQNKVTISQLIQELDESKKKLTITQPLSQSQIKLSNSIEGGTEYRLTSYYVGDECESSTTTGSGKDVSDFKINEKGWYTYEGKLVIATATRYLLKYGYSEKSNIRYFKYYDILTLVINGQEYEAIVLDSCGAAMKKPIIDLFVADASSVINAQITVK